MSPHRAILSAGNFWNLQDIYEHHNGILYTQVGYTGGWLPTPKYHDVLSGTSGHVEAVEITYNPLETTYEEILETFFKSYNYDKSFPFNNTIIFYLNNEQQKIAEQKLQQHQKRYKTQTIPQIRPASTFYPAELHHQHYLIKPGQTSCCLNKEC